MRHGPAPTRTAPLTRTSRGAAFLIRSKGYQNPKAAAELVRQRTRLFARLARDRGRRGTQRDDRA
ncbi:hypothetical protein GCM10010983_51990 [Caulobacter rhizosphaerae]|nr:hypothetical protein GCM10010983_51990 [Caulobacter rhizosphaerae]